MRNRIVISMLAVAALTCAWMIGTVRAEGKGSDVKVGSAAPDFSLVDQSGATVNMKDLAGKIVVLEWTNPNCPYVERHYKAKTMIDLAAKYKDKGVVWLAIDSNTDESPADIKAFANGYKIAYPVLNDGKQNVASAYGAKSTPDMFVIGKDGKIAYEGAIDNDPDGEKSADKVNYVQQALDELLADKAVSIPETKSYGCGVHTH